MTQPYRVALQGFSAFERSTLASFFRLAGDRAPAYTEAGTAADADFFIVDADRPDAVKAVLAAGRVQHGVYIGAHPPDGASAWMARPIDPLHVMRELDAMVIGATGGKPATEPDSILAGFIAGAAAPGDGGDAADQADAADIDDDDTARMPLSPGAMHDAAVPADASAAEPPPPQRRPSLLDAIFFERDASTVPGAAPMPATAAEQAAAAPTRPAPLPADPVCEDGPASPAPAESAASAPDATAPQSLPLPQSLPQSQSLPQPEARSPGWPLFRPPSTASPGSSALPADAPDDTAATAAATPSVLLVDDSEIALRFLETRLQRIGLRTASVSTSGEAIESLSKARYDCVFLDVDLGPASDLDGLALCQRIKRQQGDGDGRAAPVVVMVSAFHSELDRARGALAGADAYVGKPLDEAALARLLRQQGLAVAAA